jgi:REP element-mobilizing transposase RayT
MRFGHVAHNDMILNGPGLAVFNAWQRIGDDFPTVALDEFVTMPNHVHFIIWLHGRSAEFGSQSPDRKLPTLGDIAGAFKSTTTNHYIDGVNKDGWRPFRGRLWQRNYYDKIVRNQRKSGALAQRRLSAMDSA